MRKLVGNDIELIFFEAEPVRFFELKINDKKIDFPICAISLEMNADGKHIMNIQTFIKSARVTTNGVNIKVRNLAKFYSRKDEIKPKEDEEK